MKYLDDLSTNVDTHHVALHRLDSICHDMEDEFRDYLKNTVAASAKETEEAKTSKSVLDAEKEQDMQLLRDFASGHKKASHYIGRVGKLSLEETAWFVQEKKVKELANHHKKSLELLSSIEAKQDCLDKTFREQRDATSSSMEMMFEHLVHQNYKLEYRLNTAVQAIEGVSAT